MIRLLSVFVLLLALAVPAAAQTTVRERTDQVFMIGSLSMASVALGLTMACTSTGECRELNPVMAKQIDVGPVRATMVKATLNGATTYLFWRLTKGKTRTILLGAMFAVNAWDAVHDIRQMRKLHP